MPDAPTPAPLVADLMATAGPSAAQVDELTEAIARRAADRLTRRIAAADDLVAEEAAELAALRAAGRGPRIIANAEARLAGAVDKAAALRTEAGIR